MKLPLLLVLAAGAACAEPLYITVPGEGWALKLEAPAMTNIRATADERRLRYLASSIESGITLSLHTETEGGSSNADCRDIYWKNALASPATKTDIVQSGTDRALFVTHRTEVVYRGETRKTANGHAYFVKNGLCMDLHVSHWPYQAGSEQRVDAVLRSLAIVP